MSTKLYKIDLRLTTPHTKGPKVKEAQALLKHNRNQLDFHPGKTDGEYGPHTATATHRAKYLLGYPQAECTDTFGSHLYSYLVEKSNGYYQSRPASYWPRAKLRQAAYKRAQQQDFRGKATDLALTQVGTTEHGYSNDVKYNTWYYGHEVWGGAYPWCAVFASWCYSHTGRSLHYASVGLIYSDAQARRNGLELIGTPARGDLVCLDNLGHVGIFLRFVAGNQFEYVSGNTGGGNIANGGAVEVHPLPRSIVNGWVRVNR